MFDVDDGNEARNVLDLCWAQLRHEQVHSRGGPQAQVLNRRLLLRWCRLRRRLEVSGETVSGENKAKGMGHINQGCLAWLCPGGDPRVDYPGYLS